MIRRVFSLLVCFLAATLPAWAQSEIGGASLSGTVTDPSAAAVADAKVSVVNKATGLTRVTETNEAGLYNLVRLPVGSYELSVEKQGFKLVKRTDVNLSVGAVATLDIRLEIGATQEVITVTEEAPLIESSRSQTSTVVNAGLVDALPVNGRNFLDIALMTPGVVRDPRGGDLSFGGQRGTANSLLVDGGDSNNIFFGQSSGRAGTRNPYSFSQDAVQEFQVNASGYNAEVGRAGAGVINVITKSGTNDLHGTAFWFFRDRAMNANTFINNSRNIRKPPYHYNQFGGNAGGPIARDKLFFFFDYEGQRNKNPNTVFLSPAPPSDPLSQQAGQELQKYLTTYTRNFDNDIYLTKIDWNIDASRRLSVRYNAHRFHGANLENSGTNSALDHTGNSNVVTDNIAAGYTNVMGGSTVWDTRFVFLRDDEPGTANSTAPEAVIRQAGATAIQIGRNNFSPRYTNAKRYQIIQTLSQARGRHSLKFGGDLNFERIDNFFPGLFGGAYSFNSYADFAARRPFSYTQAFAGAGTDGPLTRPNIREFALFAQDAWRASRKLTLNYGVRYDLMDSADPKVNNPDPGLAARRLSTSRMNLDTNNLGARFGFARELLGERLLLRGGYGIYYARTPAIMTGTAHSQNGIQVRTFELRANMPAYPQVLSAPPAAGVTPNLYLFAPDYVQPQTHQWSLNLETALGRDYALTLGYLGVRGAHLSRTRDVNLYPAEPVDGRFADGAAVRFFRHPGAAAPARPNLAFGRISVFDSGADSIYHGGFIQLTKRYSRNFQLQTSHTWSKVIDSAPNQVSVVVPFDDGLNTQDTLLPGLDRGSGDADVRHRFIFAGVWDLSYARSLSNPALKALLRDYQVSIISNVQSGRWYSAQASGDPNNNSQTATDRPPGAGRNTIEGPGFAAVDARVSRDIAFSERAKLRLIFEAFNLTNRSNFSGFLRGQYTYNAATRVFTPVASFLQRNASADPRILQLAAKIIW